MKVFTNSLSLHFSYNKELLWELVEVKFEEIMIYLLDKYRKTLISFLLNTLQLDSEHTFKNIIEANKYTNLRIEELAFLCNMSLSTFKRHFAEMIKETPSSWFKQRRLERCKQLLQSGKAMPSKLFRDFGDKNLSHFSSAYKAQSGKSPRQLTED